MEKVIKINEDILNKIEAKKENKTFLFSGFNFNHKDGDTTIPIKDFHIEIIRKYAVMLDNYISDKVVKLRTNSIAPRHQRSLMRNKGFYELMLCMTLNRYPIDFNNDESGRRGGGTRPPAIFLS